MKFWAGVTDNDWYTFLSARGLDEVNFWRPSPGPYFTSLPAGAPFLFKLKAPYNHPPYGGLAEASSRTCLPKARILHPAAGNGLGCERVVRSNSNGWRAQLSFGQSRRFEARILGSSIRLRSNEGWPDESKRTVIYHPTQRERRRSELLRTTLTEKNGTATFLEFDQKIRTYRRLPKGPLEMGNNVLVEPFFFPKDQWIPLPDWPRSVVQGKTFDTETTEGAWLWNEVQQRM